MILSFKLNEEATRRKHMFRYLLTLFSFVNSNDLARSLINLSSKLMFNNNNTFLRAQTNISVKINNLFQHPIEHETLYDAIHSTWMFYNVSS